MNAISFSGSESTGSIGKRIGNNTATQEPRLNNEPIKDTVSFRGSDYEEKKSTSLITKIGVALGITALAIGGLGYAHKADLVGKLKDGKVKDFLRKSDCVTEKCHEWCSKVKKFFVKNK